MTALAAFELSILAQRPEYCANGATENPKYYQAERESDRLTKLLESGRCLALCARDGHAELL